MNPKKLGKNILCTLLERQVKRLRQKNDFKVVAVSGSAGKTSTKLAIAHILSGPRKVVYQEGNYNDRLTVPLVFFGQEEPGIFNVIAWIKILLANRRALKRPYDYEIAVVELGTDAPGQLEKFAYLKPDLVVITSIAAEHMEFFGDLDAVAKEELVPLSYSASALLNRDDIPAEYAPQAGFKSYGFSLADYTVLDRQNNGLNGQALTFGLPGDRRIEADSKSLGDQGAKITLAAVAVADLIGLSTVEISNGIANIKPVSGRMQILAGQQDSTLIDDTYNASPVAMIAALDVLQLADAPQRIAILGSMNELGTASPAMHAEVAAHLDPQKVELIITVGKIAAEQLAPAAKERGCTVMSFKNPYDAGNYALSQLKPGAVVLAKGSQNGVFAEEALKILLSNPEDAGLLVRQSAYWLKQKEKQFGKPSAPKHS